MFANILSTVLTSNALRDLFFNKYQFDFSNIKVTKGKEGTWIDNKAYVYEKYVHYKYDRVDLVDAGTGNYENKKLTYNAKAKALSKEDRAHMYANAGNAKIF